MPGAADQAKRTVRVRLTILLACAVAFELVTMAVVDRLAIPSAAIEALIDAGILAVLLVPALFLLVVRPLTDQVSDRERSELALQASEKRLLSSLHAMEASEARYRLLADHMTDTIWLLDMNLNITYASPSVQRMRGYTPEEIVAMPLEQHLTAASLQRALEAFSEELPRIMADPNYWPRRTLELEHRCKGGTTVWSESTFSIIRDENGSPASILGESREITDRRLAEEAMRDSERRLRTIVDAEPECVKLIDAECTLLNMNKAGLAMIEAESVEQVRGQSVLDLIAPEYHTSYRAGIAAVLRGDSVTQTFEMIGLLGTHRWMEQSAVRLANSNGPDQVLAITRDVTDRKRSEDALQQSATMLAIAQRIGALGSYVLDTVSGTWTSSEVLDDIFGIEGTYDRSFGGWLNVVHPEWRSTMAAYFEEDVIAQRGRFDREYQIVRPIDGQMRWVHGLGELEFDANGQVTRMVGTIQDITSRKEADEARSRARAVESRLAALVESSEDAIGSIDRKGRFTSWNPAAERLFGFSASEVIGRHWAFLDPNYRSGEPEPVGEQVTLGQVVHMEAERRTRDGRLIPVSITFFPFKDPSAADDRVVEVGVIARDLTNERRAEAERARLEEQFQQAQRLESLGLLARGVAHDFNNHLSSILGYTQLALNALPASADVRTDLEIVEASAAASADLVRQLMLYSGNIQPAKARLDLSAVVADMTRLLAAKLGRLVTLETSLETGLPHIEADAVQIRQMIMNLVSNAGEAIVGRPGRVVVATGTVCAGPDELSRAYGPSSLEPGPCVFLNVVDNGTGMNSQTMSHLFEPFYTTKEGGHGLGMASVFGIVRSHGGAIAVASEPGAGTTFHILFPLA